MLALFKRFEEIFSSITMGVMTLIIAMQVFNRYVLSNSLDWTEELARYLFIWSIYVGCSYAMQEDRHLEVTVIRQFTSKKISRIITIIAYILTIIFCLFCVVYGVKMLLFLGGTGQKAPALLIPMYWFFASIPVGLGLMAIRTGERIWKLINNNDSSSSQQEV